MPAEEGPEVTQSPPDAATPPPAPTPPAAVVERAPAIDPARGLTKAEMAWMSKAVLAAGAPQEEGNLPRAEAAVSPPVPPPPRLLGKRLLRIVLAAVILCGLAALAVKLVWPGLGGPRIPPQETSALAPPPPAPPSPVVTETPPPQPPEPAPSPMAEVPPSPPPGPIRLGPRARLERGTVTVDKLRRAERQRLDRNERRLLDLLARKEDGPAPPEPVERLDLDAGSLAPAAVERVLADNQGAFSGCVTREAKKGTEGQRVRRATLLLTVGGNGEVAAAWVAEPELSRSGIGKCIVTSARRLVFPAFEGGAVDVSVPLVLEAR
ncbi:MAG TPA: AgmX/PglI C-terminal domain-containing protein [Anaeromyxobacter sp.]|nr:AgmX/PglI C-terminal domain-containing protein [Anaeromyxobacter sp.]